MSAEQDQIPAGNNHFDSSAGGSKKEDLMYKEFVEKHSKFIKEGKAKDWASMIVMLSDSSGSDGSDSD